jgi:hypothetical protein
MIGIRIRVLQFIGDEAGAQESLAQLAIGFNSSGRGVLLTRLRSFAARLLAADPDVVLRVAGGIVRIAAGIIRAAVRLP